MLIQETSGLNRGLPEPLGSQMLTIQVCRKEHKRQQKLRRRAVSTHLEVGSGPVVKPGIWSSFREDKDAELLGADALQEIALRHTHVRAHTDTHTHTQT